MKKSITTYIIVTLGLLTIISPSMAQDDNKDDQHKDTHNSLSIDLGMNNYLENGNCVDSDAPYNVKPWGSWFIALNSINDTPVDGALHLYWGGGVSFNTFKFEDPSVRLMQDDEGLQFIDTPVEYAHKSKLDVAYLNISAVPMFHFGKDPGSHWVHFEDEHFKFSAGRKGGFRIGAGGYAGYRLGSKAKYVTKEGGDKDKTKDHDSFYLNNWRYGVRFQVGFSELDLFVNYDLNELFTQGRGPELHAFSFGVIL